MSILRNIFTKVKYQRKKILLIEYNDSRVIKASMDIVKDNIANIYFLGDKKEIYNNINKIEQNFLNQYSINVIEPKTIDKHIIKQVISTGDINLDLGHILLKNNIVDGMVSGATIHTKNMLRSALKNVGLKDNIKTLSSYFLIESKFHKPLLFADCAVNINPNAEQLSDIALSTIESYRLLFERSPNVALLSYSTKCDKDNEYVKKIRDAVEIIRDKNKDICIDGELQLDTAIIPEIAHKKAPKSVIEGNADILIFPNLDSGNIGYKLVERLGKCIATGPVLQGLNKPSNDLSRGCSNKDIYNMIGITSIQE